VRCSTAWPGTLISEQGLWCSGVFFGVQGERLLRVCGCPALRKCSQVQSVWQMCLGGKEISRCQGGNTWAGLVMHPAALCLWCVVCVCDVLHSWWCWVGLSGVWYPWCVWLGCMQGPCRVFAPCAARQRVLQPVSWKQKLVSRQSTTVCGAHPLKARTYLLHC
jgi:hypothetical protein